MKQGIELQFHWIFILIAGALILAFFFSVVQKQRALSEEKLSITLASQMDAIFTGAIESKGTTQALATPKPGIAFACSKVCECNYYIGRKATEFRDKLLFAPSFLKDQDAIAWAVEWKLPFRIANFLFLTNPNIRYYLVYDAGDQRSVQTYQRVSKQLPQEINAEVFSSLGAVSQLSPQGYAHTRFVFLGLEPVSPGTLGLSQDWAEEDVSAVAIDDDLATAVFYDKTDPDELFFSSRPAILAGDATVYAAIFAADYNMYTCVLQRAFDRMSVIAAVSGQRAKLLQAEMDKLGRVECTYILQNLDDVSKAAAQLTTAQGLQEQEAAFAVIRSAQSELQRQNNNLILQSCPELY